MAEGLRKLHSSASRAGSQWKGRLSPSSGQPEASTVERERTFDQASEETDQPQTRTTNELKEATE